MNEIVVIGFQSDRVEDVVFPFLGTFLHNDQGSNRVGVLAIDFIMFDVKREVEANKVVRNRVVPRTGLCVRPGYVTYIMLSTKRRSIIFLLG